MKPEFPKLKIKIKSLAAEARIIRKEELATMRVRVSPPGVLPPVFERRLKNPRGYRSLDGDWHIGCGDDLYHHRTLDVRRESRAALIAYGFLRGVPYRAVEPGRVRPGHDRPEADWNRVKNIVLNFGSFGSSKEARDKVAADIVAWRAVPAAPWKPKQAFLKAKIEATPITIDELLASYATAPELLEDGPPPLPDAPEPCPASWEATLGK